MKKAIGIDLGTTNSAVAFKDTSVKIIRNKDNEELTRSCIGLRGDDFLIGDKVYRDIERDPVNTILSIKRLMGGSINDKMVRKMKNNDYYKYGITSLKGGTEDTVAVILGGKQYTPDQISAKIIIKLKKNAEESEGEVTHAVITVPAYFTEKQKNATRIAARSAGLKVQKLLAEPTAAAIDYGIDNLKTGDAKTVLIYDFGGGTFDLSILNIVDGQYMEAGTGGDRWLGGDDIDKKLYDFVLQKVASDYFIDDIHSLIENNSNQDSLEKELKLKAEEAKIQLSSSQSAEIYIDNFMEDETDEIIDIDVFVSREELNKHVKQIINRSIDLIEELLKEVGYEISMIDNILLVGGTSQIPLVKEMLVEKYGVEKIKSSEKPMRTVARGAGILSHRLGDEYEKPVKSEKTIDDISYSTNHNYFIELKGNPDKIIEKQMPLPIETTKIYKTTVKNQKITKIEIYADVEDDKKEKQTMGFYTVDEELPAGSEIVLDIRMDIDETLTIKASPKKEKKKSKKIILGRGQKDSKTLNFLADKLDDFRSYKYGEKQREFFLSKAEKAIDRINSLGVDDPYSEEWNEIGESIFYSYEKAEEMTITEDEYNSELALTYGEILINEYPKLVENEHLNLIKKLLPEININQGPTLNEQALERLKEITDQYTVLLVLYTVKVVSNNAAEENPSDAHRLLQMHVQIVNHFKHRRWDEAFALLDKAIELRDQYSQETNLADMYHLRK
jgi:molecular chaperone DnaK